MDRQTDRQTGRQTGRQTDKQIEREGEIEGEIELEIEMEMEMEIERRDRLRVSTAFRQPCITTTHLSYRFPIFEASTAALRGTTGEDYSQYLLISLFLETNHLQKTLTFQDYNHYNQ